MIGCNNAVDVTDIEVSKWQKVEGRHSLTSDSRFHNLLTYCPEHQLSKDMMIRCNYKEVR